MQKNNKNWEKIEFLLSNKQIQLLYRSVDVLMSRFLSRLSRDRDLDRCREEWGGDRDLERRLRWRPSPPRSRDLSIKLIIENVLIWVLIVTNRERLLRLRRSSYERLRSPPLRLYLFSYLSVSSLSCKAPRLFFSSIIC